MFRSRSKIVSFLLSAGMLLTLVAALFFAGRSALQKDSPKVLAASDESVSWTLTLQDSPLRGSGQLSDLGSTLFDSDIDFLGGVVELVINLPSDGNALTLNLEARNTTGYVWQVLPAEGLSFSEKDETTFAPRSRGYGAPSVQTLVLKTNGKGNATARLVYRRPFEPDEQPHATLILNLSSAVHELSLLDPTPQEFIEEVSVPSQEGFDTLPDLKGLPAVWDWRTKGIVPAVRNQGTCGSCWAFGTVGVMETALAKAGKGIQDLSEQFLLSCNTHGWNCARGGLTASMYHFDRLGKSQTKIGAVLENAKPYLGVDGTCTVDLAHPYKLSSWQFVSGTSDWDMPTTEQVKNAIYSYGPVTAGVCIGSGWSSYKGGVYTRNDTNCGTWSNHQIVLVGWDDTQGDHGVWIMRNSWGPNWGDAGYMYIPYGYGLVGQGASWAKIAAVLVPVPKAPIGIVTTHNPTYLWSKIKGATIYRYQVLQGETVLIDKSPDSGVCSGTTCERTPTFSLSDGAYKWRVRAFVGGMWKSWSGYKEFTVAVP